jgi:hypothetical protein
MFFPDGPRSSVPKIVHDRVAVEVMRDAIMTATFVRQVHLSSVRDRSKKKSFDIAAVYRVVRFDEKLFFALFVKLSFLIDDIDALNTRTG